MTCLRFSLLLAAGLALWAGPVFSETEEAFLESGWMAYQRGDYSRAISLYEEQALASPKDAGLRYDLGCMHILEGDFLKGRECLLEALSLDPNLAGAYDALGQLYERWERPEWSKPLYAAAWAPLRNTASITPVSVPCGRPARTKASSSTL